MNRPTSVVLTTLLLGLGACAESGEYYDGEWLDDSAQALSGSLTISNCMDGSNCTNGRDDDGDRLIDERKILTGIVGTTEGTNIHPGDRLFIAIDGVYHTIAVYSNGLNISRGRMTIATVITDSEPAALHIGDYNRPGFQDLALVTDGGGEGIAYGQLTGSYYLPDPVSLGGGGTICTLGC